MKLKICLLALLCLNFYAKAQNDQPRHPLKIGDKMPDLTISNLLNTDAKHIRISDLKGKLVILDFWEPYCGSCLHSFPKLDSLQREFGSAVQIILINPVERSTKLADVNLVVSRMKQQGTWPFAIPVAVQDKIVKKRFNFFAIPNYVWIDREGIIRAITGSEQVSREHLEAMIKGENVYLPEKIDRLPGS